MLTWRPLAEAPLPRQSGSVAVLRLADAR